MESLSAASAGLGEQEVAAAAAASSAQAGQAAAGALVLADAGAATAGANASKPDNLASLLSLLAGVLRLYPDLFLDEALRYDVLGVFMGHLAAHEVGAGARYGGTAPNGKSRSMMCAVFARCLLNCHRLSAGSLPACMGAILNAGRMREGEPVHVVPMKYGLGRGDWHTHLATALPWRRPPLLFFLQALQQAPSVFVAYMDVLTALASGEKGARIMYQQVRQHHPTLAVHCFAGRLPAAVRHISAQHFFPFCTPFPQVK